MIVDAFLVYMTCIHFGFWYWDFHEKQAKTKMEIEGKEVKYTMLGKSNKVDFIVNLDCLRKSDFFFVFSLKMEFNLDGGDLYSDLQCKEG